MILFRSMAAYLRFGTHMLLLIAFASTANANRCNWNDYLSYLFTKETKFNKATYAKKVEEFEKAISSNQLSNLDKLSKIDQVALMEALTKTNRVNPLNLAEILEKDPVFRNKILKITKQLKSKNGYRLSNLNNVFDELISATNPKFDALMSRKWKGKQKELIDQWIEQELGRQNMETTAKNLGILKDENAFEKFRLWKQRHRNAIELSINGSTNGPLVYFFKTPGKLPEINFFRRNPKLFEKIEREGLESIKPEIYAHYKNRAFAQIVYDNIKKNYGRAFKALVVYYTYQNWAEIKKQTKLAYYIASTGIQNLLIDDQELQDQINKTFSLEKAQEEEIINTLETLADESNGKLQPEDIWNQVKAHLELTTEDLKPNLTNPDAKLSDRKNKVQDQDIENISLKLIMEMSETTSISPSVVVQYKKWLKNRQN